MAGVAAGTVSGVNCVDVSAVRRPLPVQLASSFPPAEHYNLFRLERMLNCVDELSMNALLTQGQERRLRKSIKRTVRGLLKGFKRPTLRVVA